MKTIKLNNKVMVSDPCYGMNTWCQGVLENVSPGDYECKVEYSDEGGWGTRVSAIEVIHQGYDGVIKYNAEDFEVGVDSGQAGIFDYDYYVMYHDDSKAYSHVNDAWYEKVCSLTYETIKNPDYVSFENSGFNDFGDYLHDLKSYPHISKLTGNTIDGLGFVSSSGYGDGGYTCYTAQDKNNKIIAIRIEYITDEDYDEED